MIRSRPSPAPVRRASRPSYATLAIVVALLGGLVPVLLPGAAPAAYADGTGVAGADVVGLALGPRTAGADPALAGTARPSGDRDLHLPRAGAGSPPLPDGDWLWPVAGVRSVIAPFRAPAHDYGPGHRGIDIAAAGEVRAPADGVVAFRGVVVDRPLLTIDHGNGLVTTLEPVQSDLAPGAAVQRGDAVAAVAVGGHAPAGAVHIGVRWNGAYINPMLLFGDVPRAVLLPCGPGGC